MYLRKLYKIILLVTYSKGRYYKTRVDFKGNHYNESQNRGIFASKEDRFMQKIEAVYIDRIASPHTRQMSIKASDLLRAEGVCGTRPPHKPVLAETPRDIRGFSDGSERERADATEMANRDERRTGKRRARRNQEIRATAASLGSLTHI